MKVFALLLFICFIGYGQTDPKFWKPEIKEPPKKPDFSFIDGGNGSIEVIRFSGDTTRIITTKIDSTNCQHIAKIRCSVYGCGCGYCIDCGKRLKK